MSDDPKTIIDTAEITEDGWDGHSEPDEMVADLAATEGATGKRGEFFVQMRGFTLNEMEDLIVQAAARQILGSHNEREMSKAIEAKCIELLNAKATKALEGVTTEIIDQPMVPNWADKKPVTMREFLGLYGREYLTERVDVNGKPQGADYGRRYDNYTRMEWLVMQVMQRQFKSEMEKATNAFVRDVQAEIKKAHEAILEEQKAKLREALAKATSAAA